MRAVNIINDGVGGGERRWCPIKVLYPYFIGYDWKRELERQFVSKEKVVFEVACLQEQNSGRGDIYKQ
ncbi:hypothetical protein [Bartonella sp. AU18XJBT]|uniref:hypothetical protein n=1 Tax=Bartonella sp. AU18XJBT TaxID=3019089 RepID=UPI00235F401B|nr:hypothetical protein [Bartonella sp. AU18XJBT]